ncbi:MAG: DUF4910 domain-containing protein, partial [Dehalococcoidia bacterium]|nr:DUF4910 domain-containing protein [Dehalococcoidia bacterium]
LLQHSLQHATDRPAPYIDRVMEYAAAMREPAFAVAPYRAVVRGDDANLNGPRYRIPTVVLARWPFAEYHTSDDDITTISPAYLLRTLDVMKAAVDILECDFRPNPTSAGRPFLYGAGLWADPDGKGQVVDDLMERFVLLADGDKQVMDIAEELGMPLRKALEMAEMMRGAGLLTR